ncbi:hypothetical protein J6590_093764 [Homalodisca vitripennis]|nr:hypothetical protein J6590_093764 [Homalodisca vitripennis]
MGGQLEASINFVGVRGGEEISFTLRKYSITVHYAYLQWIRRLSQDNQIKQRRAWPLLGQVTAERSCPYKRSACPAIGGGSEVTFKPLVPRLSVREGFLALTSPVTPLFHATNFEDGTLVLVNR